MDQNNNVMPGVFKLVVDSLSLVRKNYKTFFLIALLPTLIYVIGRIPSLVLINIGLTNIAVTIIFSILSFILSIVGMIGYIVYGISLIKAIKDLDNGNSVDVKESYRGSLKSIFSYLWVCILIGLVTLGSYALFIIPGIAVSMYLFLALFLLVLEGKKGLLALSTSYYYVKGNWWKVFGRILGSHLIIIIPIIILTAILGIIYIFAIGPDSVEPFLKTAGGTVFSTIFIFILSIIYYTFFCPLILVSPYLIYKNLKSSKPEPTDADLKTTRSWFLGLSIWGLVAWALVTIVIFVFAVVAGYQAAKDRAENITTVSEIRLTNFSNLPIENYTPPIKATLDEFEYKDPAFDISIYPPKDWTEYYDNETGALVFVDLPKHPYPALTIEYFNESAATDAEAQTMLQGILDYHPEYTDATVKKVYLAENRLAYNMTVKYLSDGELAILEYYVVPEKDSVYILSTAWLDGKEEEINSIAKIKNSINTFKIIPE